MPSDFRAFAKRVRGIKIREPLELPKMFKTFPTIPIDKGRIPTLSELGYTNVNNGESASEKYKFTSSSTFGTAQIGGETEANSRFTEIIRGVKLVY